MRLTITHSLLSLLVVCLVAIGGHGQTDAPPAQAVQDVYLAKDNGKGKAGEEVKAFSTSDVPIWCVVLLETPAVATVKMNFTAVKVPGLRPDTKVISTLYTTKEGQTQVNFKGRPEGTWPPGRYRIDIFLDGRAVKDMEFDIKGAADAAALQSFAPAAPVKRAAKKP